MSEYKPFSMKGSTFYGKPKSTGKLDTTETPMEATPGETPLKGLFGKILNPAQMLPGKVGKLFGKLPGSNL